MSPLDTALGYIHRGWAPVPIPYKQKGPTIPQWQKLRIKADEAPRYFNGAALNVGVILGEDSGGLVDIDLDCAEALRVAGEILPPTEAVFGRAGKPCSHRIYHCGSMNPETGEVLRERCETTQFKDPTDKTTLVELRGDAQDNGSQTVFPGSIHPSGEPVEWDANGDPGLVRADALRRAAAELAAVALLAKHWPAGPHRAKDGNEASGGRHDANLKVAGWLTRSGCGEERAAKLLERISAAAGAERDRAKRQGIARDAAKRARSDGKLYGWTSVVELFGEKVASKAAEWLGIERARSAELDEPPRLLTRPEEPATAYPVEVLGGLLSGAAQAIHDKVQAPLAICGSSVLAGAALAAQGLADVVLPTGQRRPLSLYFVSVAASGERKSSTDYEALAPVEKREQELRSQYDFDYADYEAAAAAWKAARQDILADKKLKGRDAKEGALKDLGSAPVAPMIPMLTAPEPTYEGLCRLLATGHPSVGVFSAEGGQFIAGHAMSPDNKVKTAAALSDLWDKGLVKRLRAGDGALILPGRRVSLHLMAQPGVAELLLADELMVDQGLLSRLLVTAPNTMAGQRRWREPKEESHTALARYRAHLFAMLNCPLPLAVDKRTGEAKPNELAPRELPLSSEARELWTTWADHCDAAMAPGGDLEPIRAHANKLPEQAARIAGVLALVEDVHCAEISRERLAAAIELVKHHAAEALRLARAGKVHADLRLAQRLLEWLTSTWPEPVVSLPDIYQRSLNAIGDKATAARIVRILEDHGWLTKIEGGAEVAGCKRREAWAVRDKGGVA